MAIPALTMGVLLDQFFDRAQQFIDQVKNEGTYLEMEAGLQVRQSIVNAKVAYASSLELTMDRVDSTARNVIDQIRGSVESFQERNKATLRNLISQSQQLANTLPFHNDRPQVSVFRLIM